MPFLITLLKTILVNFGVNLVVALFSDNTLEFMFFKLARYLASKTETPIDDEFVDTLYNSFYQKKGSVNPNEVGK